MNSVAMTVPKTSRLPRNASRARAYAASASTVTTSTALITPAARLLKNQRSTGVCKLVVNTVRYASVVTGRGVHESGSDVASLGVLNDVEAIHNSGAMKMMLMTGIDARGRVQDQAGGRQGAPPRPPVAERCTTLCTSL